MDVQCTLILIMTISRQPLSLMEDTPIGYYGISLSPRRDSISSLASSGAFHKSDSYIKETSVFGGHTERASRRNSVRLAHLGIQSSFTNLTLPYPSQFAKPVNPYKTYIHFNPLVITAFSNKLNFPDHYFPTQFGSHDIEAADWQSFLMDLIASRPRGNMTHLDDWARYAGLPGKFAERITRIIAQWNEMFFNCRSVHIQFKFAKEVRADYDRCRHLQHDLERAKRLVEEDGRNSLRRSKLLVIAL